MVKFAVGLTSEKSKQLKETFTYNRKQIAAFFMVMFCLFVFAPTATVLIDSDVDVSMFYSMVEEEEESAENHTPAKKHLIRKVIDWNIFLTLSNKENEMGYHREKDYAFVLRDQFCPPPELS
ncbi:hypothetical protein [Echinicola sediminis]